MSNQICGKNTCPTFLAAASTLTGVFSYDLWHHRLRYRYGYRYIYRYKYSYSHTNKQVWLQLHAQVQLQWLIVECLSLYAQDVFHSGAPEVIHAS